MWQRPLILVIIILTLSISVNSLNINQTQSSVASSQGIRNNWNGTSAQWYGQTFLIPGSSGTNVSLNSITLVACMPKTSFILENFVIFALLSCALVIIALFYRGGSGREF